MQIFTVELLSEFATSLFSTLGILKDAIVGAIFTNIGVAFGQISAGEWTAIVGLVGTIVLLWRLKGWIIGFFYRQMS